MEEFVHIGEQLSHHGLAGSREQTLELPKRGFSGSGGAGGIGGELHAVQR